MGLRTLSSIAQDAVSLTAKADLASHAQPDRCADQGQQPLCGPQNRVRGPPKTLYLQLKRGRTTVGPLFGTTRRDSCSAAIVPGISRQA
jgi:hypothetical protein